MLALTTLSDVDVRDAAESDVVAGLPARLVARPTSPEQVSALMRAAYEDDLVVVPRAAATMLHWAPRPTACDVILDLSAMDRVLEHQAGDLIVSAEAGTPLSRVQEAVRASGQRLAIDEVVPGSTIGGLIATNLSGPRRVAYGTARDLVIGVSTVRADGVMAKSGGKVVKNVAGYDLGKLMVGSHGTLAIVTSAYFRLHPIPEAAVWLRATAPSPRSAQSLVHQAVHSQVVPAAVEIDAHPTGETTISVLLEGTSVGVAARVDRMATALGATTAESPIGDLGLPGTDAQPLLKITSQLSAVTEIAQTAVDLGLHVRGSAGAGVLFAAVPDSVDIVRAVDILRAESTAAGGATVVLRGAPDHLDAWGPVPALDLMRSVKNRFDPQHLLSPGRFVGGL
ncbi:FAD-binding oxidoreductase [Demetria terragena]|uniref:FAD-binding oxidoreductase n=1 Tax=Demetria terragena TaxID=63959 RepID=UPI0003718E14|nr:FAD-binding oxidoreductase [Demetria terragena]